MDDSNLVILHLFMFVGNDTNLKQENVELKTTTS